MKRRKPCRNFVVVRGRNCIIFRYLPLSRTELVKRTEHSEIKQLQEKTWRRGSESNRRIKVLQTSPLPLGYRAPAQYVSFPCGKSPSAGRPGRQEKHWSGRRGSNPRHRPWQGRALPLSYSRSTNPIINDAIGRGNVTTWCREMPETARVNVLTIADLLPASLYGRRACG